MRALVLTFVVVAFACAAEGDSNGIGVRVVVQGQTMPQSVAANGGTSAVLDPSYLTIVGFTLEPCDSVARMFWRAVSPLPSALAHGESSPTNLAVPVVIAIAGPRATIDVGTLEPPPDRYCSMNLAVGAADDDAVRLPDGDMVGRSLRVTGEHDGVPFSISSAGGDHVRVSFASPLELRSADATATVTFSLDTSSAFDTVDFDAVTAAADIIDGLAAGFRVAVQ